MLNLPLTLSSTSFIDAYIEPTHTLIEQKSIDKAVMDAYGFNWRTMTESDWIYDFRTNANHSRLYEFTRVHG